MKINRVIQALLAGATALLCWAAAPGCSPTADGYCAKRCDCEACDDATLALCVSSVEDTRQAAQDKSCESDFNDYFACLDGETRCIDGKIDDDGCEVELEAVKSCGVFLGNACDKYIADYQAKLAECGIDGPEDPGGVDCTGGLAKQAACLDGCLVILQCECLLDASSAGCQENLQQYSDCVVPCVQ